MAIVFLMVFLFVAAVISGYRYSQEFTIGLEINTFKTPFYKIGLFSQRYTLEDGSVEDEVVIGLFFVNVVIVFWKTVEEEI